MEHPMQRMNPKIAELWREASTTTESDSWNAATKMMERFANLIILECITAVMDGTKEGDHYAMRIEQYFDKSQGGILHFGVE